MNIPIAALCAPMRDEEPTRPNSDMTKQWGDAAKELSSKLIQRSKIKQRCYDKLDAKGAQQAYKSAKELDRLAEMLNTLPDLHPEMAATLRRQTVERIVEIYVESSNLLVS